MVVVEALVAGWEWSGDTTYGSGTPYSVTFTVPASQLGWFGQNTSPSVANRANLISGVPVYQGQNKSSHDVKDGVPWFNQAAFAAPNPFTWGDSSRNAYFGPGWENYDMALLKNIRLPGREGLMLQLRVEALNVFNHYNLGVPGTQTSSRPLHANRRPPRWRSAANCHAGTHYRMLSQLPDGALQPGRSLFASGREVAV